MGFNFELEALLRVRRLLEQRARQRLDESVIRVHSLNSKLTQAAEWNTQSAQNCSSSAPAPAGELLFANAVLTQAQIAVAACKRQKQDEELRAAELRAACMLARRERRTVSSLREQAFRRYMTEEERREQDQLDEIFLGKFLRTTQRPSKTIDSSGR